MLPPKRKEARWPSARREWHAAERARRNRTLAPVMVWTAHEGARTTLGRYAREVIHRLTTKGYVVLGPNPPWGESWNPADVVEREIPGGVC